MRELLINGVAYMHPIGQSAELVNGLQQYTVSL
jgi:hypothetical protein